MTHNSNPILWNSLLILTIVIGATVTVLILDKEHYFPELYASHPKAPDHEEQGIEEHVSLADVDTSAIHVATEVVSEPVEEIIRPVSNEYILVAGSFLSEAYARKYQETLQLKLQNFLPTITKVKQNEVDYYRVVAHHSGDRSEILSARKQLEQSGYTQTWIYKQ